MKIFRKMFVASLKDMLRDRGTIFWFLAFPLIFVFIFGIAFSDTGDVSFDIGIVNESNSPMVEEMINGMKTTSAFNVSVGSENEEMDALNKGMRDMVLVMPDIDYQKMMSGETFDISLYYDATRNQTSQVLVSAVERMFIQIENKITNRKKHFKVNAEPIQAESLSNFDYVLPGILGMSLMQLGLFGSIRFLALREKKIIRGLGVTPLPRSAVLTSEFAIRLLISMVQTFIIVFIAQLVFGVHIMNSYLSLIGIVILGTLTFISIGYVLISFVKTVDGGQGIIQAVQFPMMFLSGTFFPIEIMPEYIQPVVKIIPLTYLGDALRQVMIGGPALYSMRTNILVLLGWLIVSMVVAIKLWRWE